MYSKTSPLQSLRIISSPQLTHEGVCFTGICFFISVVSNHRLRLFQTEIQMYLKKIKSVKVLNMNVKQIFSKSKWLGFVNPHVPRQLQVFSCYAHVMYTALHRLWLLVYTLHSANQLLCDYKEMAALYIFKYVNFSIKVGALETF